MDSDINVPGWMRSQPDYKSKTSRKVLAGRAGYRIWTDGSVETLKPSQFPREPSVPIEFVERWDDIAGLIGNLGLRLRPAVFLDEIYFDDGQGNRITLIFKKNGAFTLQHAYSDALNTKRIFSTGNLPDAIYSAFKKILTLAKVYRHLSALFGKVGVVFNEKLDLYDTNRPFKADINYMEVGEIPDSRIGKKSNSTLIGSVVLDKSGIYVKSVKNKKYKINRAKDVADIVNDIRLSVS